MQLGQNHFNTGDLLLWMQVNRHPTAIIDNRKRIILMQDYPDLRCITGNRFIHTIVDDFLRQVIGARGVGIHTGAFFNRVQTGKHFDRRGIIFGIQWTEFRTVGFNAAKVYIACLIL